MPDGQTTIMLPNFDLYRTQAVDAVAHELGHVLHEIVDFVDLGEVITDCAKTSHREAFAEAFELSGDGPSRMVAAYAEWRCRRRVES